MLGVPDFSKDIEAFQRELTTIRELLEKLVELQEAALASDLDML